MEWNEGGKSNAFTDIVSFPESNRGWYWLQGCCLTGARSPEAPKLRVRATKVLFEEPEWAPKHEVFIPM